jgi:hypothetical protein
MKLLIKSLHLLHVYPCIKVWAVILRMQLTIVLKLD